MAPVFEYQARSKSGKKVNGTISADEPSLVASQLKEQGYYVTSVDQKVEKKDVGEYFSFLNRVTINDLAVFSQQFSVLINAGISLVDAIELLNDQTNNKKLQEVLREVQEEVETGSSLSDAFKNHSDVFPPLYYQLIKAGEAGGRLDTVLANLAEHYERQEELKNKVKSAMYYPVVVLIIAVLAVIGMLMFIVPQFVGMFADMGAELPLPTRILLMLSNFLQNYWWFLGGILAVIIFALLQYNKTAIGKLFFDSLKLKIPSMGILFKKIAISRFSGTL
ncbi:MAG TPA: type II secretion system F family protein, partial [Halanaerobiales bacterium]|nr:type II secretion system F family protein [Halanaerobiales bacterium]